MEQTKNENLMDKVVSLAKRRGIVFPAAEIYGGTGAIWDYGPVGALIRNNFRQHFIKTFVQNRDDVVLVDTALITKKKVLEASGHVSEFTDPMVECLTCNTRLRADKPEFIAEHTQETSHKDFSEPKKFNLMFSTFLGPIQDKDNIAYLRPETAQGMFTNFGNVLATNRVKLPFGIAQIGKSFRNEITTRSFIFRSREFEIGELEYFVRPEEDDKWFDTWVDLWEKFFLDLGINKEKLHRHPLPKEDLAHYSKATTDLYYDFPFGSDEIAGIANRTTYDLAQHEKHSGRELKFQDQESGQKVAPHVIEPTLGVERSMLALLVDAYTEENDRIFLKLDPRMAPFKVAVFPLLANKEELVKKARGLYEQLRGDFMTAWDDRGNIGKRYAAQDEIGTPWCVTVDFQTLEDDTVTVRDRNNGGQERLKTSDLADFIRQSLR